MMKYVTAYRWISTLVVAAGTVVTARPSHAVATWYIGGQCVAFSTPWSQEKYVTDLVAGRIGPPGLPFRTIIDYADAAAARDLPNTMARDEFQPEHYFPEDDDEVSDTAIEIAKERDTECSEAAAEADFKKIEDAPIEDLWRALGFLVSQDVDDTLVFYGAEIAARLDPAQFGRLAIDVTNAEPKKAWMFERARDSWLQSEIGSGSK
jgi:hypothetical protein